MKTYKKQAPKSKKCSNADLKADGNKKDKITCQKKNREVLYDVLSGLFRLLPMKL